MQELRVRHFRVEPIVSDSNNKTFMRQPPTNETIITARTTVPATTVEEDHNRCRRALSGIHIRQVNIKLLSIVIAIGNVFAYLSWINMRHTVHQPKWATCAQYRRNRKPDQFLHCSIRVPPELRRNLARPLFQQLAECAEPNRLYRQPQQSGTSGPSVVLR